MPRQTYSRSRRIYMQATLCAIFFASVALAELATRQHQGAAGTGHYESVRFGRGRLNGTLQLPDGWVVKKRESVGPRVLVAQEPDTAERHGRTLVCRVEQLTEPESPLEFLQTSDILDQDARVVKIDGGPPTESVNMGGVSGVMLQVARETVEESENQWIACCVLPGGQAVTLIMDFMPGDDPEGNRQTFHEIASSIEFRR